MQVSSPQPLRSSLRKPQAPQPSPLAPYTVPDSTRTTPRTPRTPRFATNDPTTEAPQRRNWFSREPATPRQRISNYFPAPSISPQPYPPFFPPQGYSPANSPWHTPGGQPIYVDVPSPSPQRFPPPGQIAPIDSGLGVLSPPTVGPYSRPPRDSAISEEASTRTSAPVPQQQFTPSPSPNPNYLVGSPPIPDNLQRPSDGDVLNVDPREGVLGPAGSAASPSSDGQSPPPTARRFVGGFMSGIRRAFGGGGRRKEEREQGYIEPFMAQSSAYFPYPHLQQQQQQVPNGHMYPNAVGQEFPENESTVVGHHQQQQQHPATGTGTISRDPLPLPIDTPFGSPSTVVTPFLLTRPISAASGARGDDAGRQDEDGSAAEFFAPPAAAGTTHGTSYAPDATSYAPQSTYPSYAPAPAPSSYPDPITLTQYPQPLPSPPVDPQIYTSPPQAPDYLKMPTEATSVPLSTYLQRFKAFLKMINELPWVAERPTVDYYPGLNKGEWGRRERRWTVLWTRKEGVEGGKEGRTGRLTEIDLSSSSGTPPISPQRGPNGIQYPYPPEQPYWVTQALQMQQNPQLYYSYGNPMVGQGGGMIYPYSGGEGRAFAMVYPVVPVPMQSVLGPPPSVGQQVPLGQGMGTPGASQAPVQLEAQEQMPRDGEGEGQGQEQEQYPAGYAPDHRPAQGDWGTPVHRN